MTITSLILSVSPSDILIEMLSWLAFLQRWSVLSQLLVLAFCALLVTMNGFSGF